MNRMIDMLSSMGYDKKIIDGIVDGTVRMPSIDLGIFSRSTKSSNKQLTYYDSFGTMESKEGGN